MNGAAVRFDRGLGDREPESEPAILLRNPLVSLLESGENPLAGARLEAAAVISNFDSNTSALDSRRDPDCAPLWGEFARIFKQIPEDLLQAAGIALDIAL